MLAAILPGDLIDEILCRTHRQERRTRKLPARLVVYYVVALGVFFGDAYDEVLRRLVGGLRTSRAWADNWNYPTTSSLSKARQQLGVEPMKQLFDEVCRPIGQPATPGTFYRDWRVMAVDGVVLNAPDTPVNNARFTHTNSGRFPSAYPVVRVLSLTECGTHALVGASLGTASTSEPSPVRRTSAVRRCRHAHHRRPRPIRPEHLPQAPQSRCRNTSTCQQCLPTGRAGNTARRQLPIRASAAPRAVISASQSRQGGWAQQSSWSSNTPRSWIYVPGGGVHR